MAMQKVEFEFPDGDEEDNSTIVVEDSSMTEVGAEPEPKEEKVADKKEPENDTVDIEVVDDTPEADRGRKNLTHPKTLLMKNLKSTLRRCVTASSISVKDIMTSAVRKRQLSERGMSWKPLRVIL